MDKELEELKKKNEALEKSNTELKKDNDSLTITQQELKAKIKELTTNKPRIISGHKAGSVKYVRQERTKKETDNSS